jgi:hypothetical protein
MRAALVCVALVACKGEPTPAPRAAPDAAAVAAAPKAPPDAAERGFTIEPALDLVPAGSGVWTSGGKLPPPPPEYAIFTVIVAGRETKDRPQASTLATDVKHGAPKPIQIDGLDGFLVEGKGTYERTPVTVYQVTLRDGDRTFVLAGRSSTERYTWYRAAFETMVRSFRRR